MNVKTRYQKPEPAFQGEKKVVFVMQLINLKFDLV
jgi:hypothetical protein